MDDSVIQFDPNSGSLTEQQTVTRRLTAQDFARELRFIQDEMQMLQQRYQQLQARRDRILQAVGSYKLPSDGV